MLVEFDSGRHRSHDSFRRCTVALIAGMLRVAVLLGVLVSLVTVHDVRQLGYLAAHLVLIRPFDISEEVMERGEYDRFKNAIGHIIPTWRRQFRNQQRQEDGQHLPLHRAIGQDCREEIVRPHKSLSGTLEQNLLLNFQVHVMLAADIQYGVESVALGVTQVQLHQFPNLRVGVDLQPGQRVDEVIQLVRVGFGREDSGFVITRKSLPNILGAVGKVEYEGVILLRRGAARRGLGARASALRRCPTRSCRRTSYAIAARQSQFGICQPQQGCGTARL